MKHLCLILALLNAFSAGGNLAVGSTIIALFNIMVTIICAIPVALSLRK